MRLQEIGIDRFQLARLLNDKQKQFFERVISDNVFCSQCGDIAAEGITISVILLTGSNDIMVNGTCNTCKGNVGRVFEFGEDPDFYDRAMELRGSIG
jgi:hypothetical protein